MKDLDIRNKSFLEKIKIFFLSVIKPFSAILLFILGLYIIGYVIVFFLILFMLIYLYNRIKNMGRN